MSEQSESAVDHYVWEAYYISYIDKGHQGTLFATSKEITKSRILSECGLNGDEGEWEDEGPHEIKFECNHSPFYVITVVRRAVYAE